MALERHFEVHVGDIVVTSLPKCGTTCLKALVFATAVRGVYSLAGGGDDSLPSSPVPYPT
ncbi:hypothetical protein E2562_030046 [Oryza meyeriana var. granulata]|uniref:Sulfotransferase n=1 Tax=Oryza meyeriana var. granulata TaxID=110450 RepID=A0A6G1CIF7_9ORYZ|nr:hypothetical protein E2562_030046 [Oryza meyeriana var. granulata]